MTAGQIPTPSGIGSRELLISARLRLADQSTSKGNVLRRNVTAVYPGLDEKAYQLTYCQKLPNLTTRAVRSKEYELVTGGHNYRDNSDFIAELSVLCNLKDLDFNRVIFILFRIKKSVT